MLQFNSKIRGTAVQNTHSVFGIFLQITMGIDSAFKQEIKGM